MDRNFLKTFIATYRSFTSPHQLFFKLIERYQVPDDLIHDDVHYANKIQLRVAVVIKYWVDTQFYDFDENLIVSMEQFCNQLSNDGFTDMSKRLMEQIQTKVCPFIFFLFYPKWGMF